ncbi:MAG: hypothetical protein ISR65_04795 [Bacteriovoracaceae bacterium]|nr:hypothetical protein [Bacteriovoracaceae bacterium]
MKTIYLTLLISILVCSAFAKQDNRPYTFALQARAHQSAPYNMPPQSYFLNNSPDLNNFGQVVVRIMGGDGSMPRSGIWYGDHNGHKIVAVSKETFFFSDPSLNDAGTVAFEEYNIDESKGVFLYNNETEQVSKVIEVGGPFISLALRDPIINNLGQILYRAKDHIGVRSQLLWHEGSSQRILTESRNEQISYSYLFKASFSSNGYIALKARVGKRGALANDMPDQIILIDPNGKQTIIAQDQNSDPESNFVSFANGVSVSSTGAVVFVAQTKDLKHGVFAYFNGDIIPIAQTSVNLSSIDLFTPKINKHGDIAFRGVTLDLKQAIFVASLSDAGQPLRVVIAKDDKIKTDLGWAKASRSDSHSIFDANIAINDNGDILFKCFLMDQKGTKYLGEGLFVARAQL